jgi:hypothetical protein
MDLHRGQGGGPFSSLAFWRVLQNEEPLLLVLMYPSNYTLSYNHALHKTSNGIGDPK